MKHILISLLTIFMVAACSESPQQIDTVSPTFNSNYAKKKHNPPPPIAWGAVYLDSTDWNITWDTSHCGALYVHWTDQNRPAGASNYYFTVTPQSTGCLGGLYTTTNVLYYTYGYGCSFFPSNTYSMSIRYTYNDTASAKIYVYTSKAVTVYTGRGAWYCQ